jgi:hypothetical protein
VPDRASFLPEWRHLRLVTGANTCATLDAMRSVARIASRNPVRRSDQGEAGALPASCRAIDLGHLQRAVPPTLLAAPVLLALQRTAGNAAVDRMLGDRDRTGDPVVQRENGGDGDREEQDPGERSRQSKPRNAPPGTRPIDQSGLDRETIHKIKDAIGAGPKDWVGITPEGNVITTDGDGNAEDHGHVSDYARNGAEGIPTWVWALLGVGAAIALIVLFATGVGELGLILSGVGAFAALIIRAALKAAGRGDTSAAASPADGQAETGEPGADTGTAA